MANKVSKLKFNNVTYDLADESSRAAINNLEGQLEATRVDLNNMRAAVGSPLTAATTSAMTNTSKIYVYTGTTTTVSSVTFTAGNWYYHDGTKWQLGGTYNETALETDTTLTVSGAAADAKVTGDKVTELKSDLSGDFKQVTGTLTSGADNYINLYDNIFIRHGSYIALKIDCDSPVTFQLQANGQFIKPVERGAFYYISLHSDYFPSNDVTSLRIKAVSSSITGGEKYTVTVGYGVKGSLLLHGFEKPFGNNNPLFSTAKNITASASSATDDVFINKGVIESYGGIDTDGVLNTSTQYDLTNPFIVESGTRYTVSDSSGQKPRFAAVNYYDKNYNVISKEQESSSNRDSDGYSRFTTPSGAKYAVLVLSKASQINVSRLLVQKERGEQTGRVISVPVTVPRYEKKFWEANGFIVDKTETLTANQNNTIPIIDGIMLEHGATIKIAVSCSKAMNIQLRANNTFVQTILPNREYSVSLNSDFFPSGDITSILLFIAVSQVTESVDLTVHVEYLNSIISTINRKVNALESASTGFNIDGSVTVVAGQTNTFQLVSDVFIPRGENIYLMLSSDATYPVQVLANNNRFVTSVTCDEELVAIPLQSDFFPDEYATSISISVTSAYATASTIGYQLVYGGVNLANVAIAKTKELDERTFAVPLILKDHIEEKIAEINEYEMAAGADYDSFVFVTDTHVASNRLYSANLIKKIVENTSVDKVIFGGDAVSAYGTRNQVIQEAHTMRNKYQSALTAHTANLYFVRGNHDIIGVDNITDPQNPVGFYVDDKATFSVFARNKDVVWGDYDNNKFYFYFDDEIKKVRYICLDSTELHNPSITNTWPDAYGFTQGQTDFLVDALNGVSNKDGWSVIIVSHVTLYGGNTDALYVVPKGIVDAFANKSSFSYNDTIISNGIEFPVSVSVDYSSNKAILIGAVAGHRHADYINTDNNVHHVITSCDTRDGSNMDDNRYRGTVGEVCFDVFCINKTTKTVNIVRVGAGADRQFTY